MTTRPRPVVDQLRDLVLSGELRPGENLLEIPTAKRLGISRTPLRPALAALAQEGLLQPRGARGYLVRPVSRQDLLDAFLVRAELEGLAVRIVATRGIDDAVQAEFEATLTEGDTLLAERPPDFFELFSSMNERFHRLLVTQSKNDCLIDLTARALSRPLLSSRLVHFEDAGALARSHDDHWEVYGTILRRESDRARSIMTEHILRSRDIIMRKFDIR